MRMRYLSSGNAAESYLLVDPLCLYCDSFRSVLANGLLDQDDKTSSKFEYLSQYPKASDNQSTSSDAQTPNVNDEANTVTTVRNPYIIFNGNTAEVVQVDKVMI